MRVQWRIESRRRVIAVKYDPFLQCDVHVSDSGQQCCSFAAMSSNTRNVMNTILILKSGCGSKLLKVQKKKKKN